MVSFSGSKRSTVSFAATRAGERRSSALDLAAAVPVTRRNGPTRSYISLSKSRVSANADQSRQTKTNAKKEYHLNEEELFAEKGDGLPVINYGSYSVEGTAATMFLRSDVERLADAVHGDWKEHMKDRVEIAKKRKAEKHGRLVQLMCKTYF